MIKILIVDDDPDIRKILYKILSCQGYEVLLAPDPLNAFSVIKNNMPQFLILDRMLQFIEGDKFLKKIKISYPYIKIIILTGYDDEGSKNKLLEDGADLFLSKSLSISQIVGEITSFIKKNSQTQNTTKENQTLKILVVDDDENIRKFISKFLITKGFNVLVSENGINALDILKTEKPNIVFLDIFMPEMSGEEFIEKALLINPQIKIVVISGNETEEIAKRMLKKGAFDYLKKPINFSQLEIITKILSIIIEQ